MTRTVCIALTAAGCLLGAFAGHQLGRRSIEVAPSDTISEAPKPAAPETELDAVPPPAAPDISAILDEISKARVDGDDEGGKAAIEQLRSLDREHLVDALATAAKLRGREKMGPMYALMSRFAELDPDGAIRYVIGEISVRERYEYARPVFSTIAEKHGGAKAFEFWEKHLGHIEEQVSISALFPIFHRWRSEDLDAAIAASTRVSKNGRHQMITTLSEGAGKAENRALLLPWALGLSDDKERGYAIESITSTWAANENAEVVLAWAAENQLSGIEMASVERAAAEEKLRKQPEEAAEWLMAQADDDSRSEHLAFVIDNWAIHSPNAAGEWLGKQTLDAGADAAISKFVWAITREEPETAHEWAKLIKDPQRRERSLNQVMGHWRRLDPVAAAAATQ